MEVALTSRFIPSASLANAPEDVIAQILKYLAVLDVLACSRRLFQVSHARILWLEHARKVYSRRFLPVPNLSNAPSRLSATLLENRATRPLRFLRALSDVREATFRYSSFLLSNIVTTLSDDLQSRSAVICFHLVPGGRWLFLIVNCRTSEDPSTAMLYIWDLWRGVRVAKNPFVRSSNFAHILPSDTDDGVILVMGYDKTRQQDPFFSVLHVELPISSENPLRVTRLGAYKAERTPRACTVHGTILAWTDRLGHVTFWDWKNQASARMIIGGWPPHKGKLMLLSENLIASFNQASSAFTVHRIPPLTPQIPVTVNLSVPPGPEGLPGQAQPDAALLPPPVIPLENAPPPNMPSMGLRRFRLPSRNLHITVPDKVTASAFFPSNAYFSDPFQAYFVLAHPDNPSHLHLGLIPTIDDDRNGSEGSDGLSDDSSTSDEEQEIEDSFDPASSQPIVDPFFGSQDMALDPPLHALDPPPPAIMELHPNALPHPIPLLGPPPAHPPPILQQGPDATWLTTLRCVDSTTHDTFSPRGRILHVGPLDHSVSILRSTDEGKLEIFTTTALHSKPETSEIAPPRKTQHQNHRLSEDFRANFDMDLHQSFLEDYLMRHAPGLFRDLPGVPINSTIGRDLMPYLPPEVQLSQIADGQGHAGSSTGGGLRGYPMPPPRRNTTPSTPSPKKRSKTDNNPPEAVSQFSQAEASETPSASPEKSNPHARFGPYAEGDFQRLAYQADGDIWAATLDDMSGKICLVVEGPDRIQVVILDYGWDFWKPEANEELQWLWSANAVPAAGTPDSADAPDSAPTRSRSV